MPRAENRVHLAPHERPKGNNMDLRPPDEVIEVQATFDRLFAKESSPARVRAAEPSGFDAALWNQLADMGVATMGVPEAAGGDGADLRVLAAIAESVGRFLAPAPVIESIVAGRLASAAGVGIDIIAQGVSTLALRPAVRGMARLVPAGAVADRVLVLNGDDLVLVTPTDARRASVLGSMPMADVAVGADARVLLQGSEAVQAHRSAVSEWKTLMALALAGMAAEAIRIAVDYAKVRHQFGVPIGSFQGVAQPLADHATSAEGARLLGYEAAWAADTASPRASTLASMAYLFSTHMAHLATAHALHVHGGYGYMLEYDVQLYFRRAKGWPLALGDVPSEYDRLADLVFGDRKQAI
jgi:alkylation response protein AidB-like acyl-CoA dehydrogenase